MKIKSLFMVLMVMAGVTFFAVNDRAESLGIERIIQGTVKEARGNSIKILNDLNDNEIKLGINSNTVFEDIQKLTDLKAGDKVQIVYQEDQSKDTATMITKLEMYSEDSL